MVGENIVLHVTNTYNIGIYGIYTVDIIVLSPNPKILLLV